MGLHSNKLNNHASGFDVDQVKKIRTNLNMKTMISICFNKPHWAGHIQLNRIWTRGYDDVLGREK